MGRDFLTDLFLSTESDCKLERTSKLNRTSRLYFGPLGPLVYSSRCGGAARPGGSSRSGVAKTHRSCRRPQLSRPWLSDIDTVDTVETTESVESFRSDGDAATDRPAACLGNLILLPLRPGNLISPLEFTSLLTGVPQIFCRSRSICTFTEHSHSRSTPQLLDNISSTKTQYHHTRENLRSRKAKFRQGAKAYLQHCKGLLYLSLGLLPRKFSLETRTWYRELRAPIENQVSVPKARWRYQKSIRLTGYTSTKRGAPR